MVQLVSILGALAVLSAYAANQFRWLGPPNLSYALLNFFGAGTLTVVSIIERQWGFLLLEGVWALVSLWAAVKLIVSSSPNISHKD